MFWHIVTQSIRHRWNRILVALLAVILGASLAAAALTVSDGMEEKVGRTLRAYGANIVLVPHGAALGESDATFKESDLARINQASPSIMGYAPFLYAIVESQTQTVVLAGTWFDSMEKIAPWWTTDGEAPARGELATAVVGTNAAVKLGAGKHDEITVRYRDRVRTFHIMGILSTGGVEDDEILVSLAAAQELTHRPGQVSLSQVSALNTQAPIDEVGRSIERTIPGVQAKTVRQIAEGEVALVRRVQVLLGLIAAMVLVAAGVSVGATMTTVMLERKREVSLMKALGAESRRIGALFITEATALGIIGGVAGYALGFVFAQIIAQSVFASAVALNGWIALAALGIAVSVAVIGSAIPVQRALAVQPAVVLRGE